MPTTTSLPIGGRANLNSDPTRNFRFLVTFQPYDATCNPIKDASLYFGFTAVGGLSMAIESIPYREGGMNTTLHQIPGQATFSPLTLTRGIHLGSDQAWRWIKRLFAALGPGEGPGQSGLGYPAYQFRTSVTVAVLQHPLNFRNDSATAAQISSMANYDEATSSPNDMVAFTFRFYNAWISALAYSDLNAGDNAIAVEQMTLVHEGFDMFWNPASKLGTSEMRQTSRENTIPWIR